MQFPNSSFQYQNDLAHFCRTGEYIPIPGIIEKNVDRYRNLIYNIVDDSLQSAYPLTSNLLEEKEWDDLVHEFFSSHRCQSPLLWQMPKELLEFMQETDNHLLVKYPVLSDLLMMEWYEVEIFMMEDKEIPKHKIKGKLSTDALIINPELAILSLAYPVHLKNAAKITVEDKDQYFVCLHREPESGKVIFTDIKYPHVELIELLLSGEANFGRLLKIFLKYAKEEEAVIALNQFLNASIESKLIFGFKNQD